MKTTNYFKIIAVIVECCLMLKYMDAQNIYDTVNFESPTTRILLDTSTSNLWQIGKPQKPIFNAAHSPNRSIVTDTINHYPPNATSSFTYIIGIPYTSTCNNCLYFWHKYDMDTIGDKGIIEASYDGGNSWLILKDTILFPFFSWFHWLPDYYVSTGTNSPHKLIMKGSSNGWVLSSFCWRWFVPVRLSSDTIIIMPDTLMIRFKFISDSISKNKDGWMIDDIVFEKEDPMMCTNVSKNNFNLNVTVSPNPFSSKCIIHSNKSFNNAKLELYNFTGQKVKEIHSFSGNDFVLSRENLPSGLYLLHIIEDTKIVDTKKVMISD